MDDLFVDANGFTFRGFGAGPSDGAPVVLLHGFPETSWEWRDQIEALSGAGYRAIAIDQRGYSPGARPDDPAAYHIDNLVDDVVHLANALGFERFHLVGHDWGGMVAWVVAARHPTRLRTLTVISTPHPLAFRDALREDGGDQSNRSSYMSFFRQVGTAEQALLGDDNSGSGLKAMFVASGLDSDDVDVFVDAMREPGALTAALNWYRANLGDDTPGGNSLGDDMPRDDPPGEDTLGDDTLGAIGGVGSVSVPTMYIWSTEDVALGRSAAEATGDHVTGHYRFEILDGVSHWVPETAPRAVNGLLLDFLETEGVLN